METNKIEKEATKVLIERHLQEFEHLVFQKKKELEAFGEFVR